MSNSKKIKLWKDKSQIDYITLYIPLWLSFAVWLSDEYSVENKTIKDREIIEKLKRDSGKVKEKFLDLLEVKIQIPLLLKDFCQN